MTNSNEHVVTPVERLLPARFFRRMLLSTSVLQAQLPECCCEKEGQVVLIAKKSMQAVAGDISARITIKNSGAIEANNVVIIDTMHWRNRPAVPTEQIGPWEDYTGGLIDIGNWMEVGEGRWKLIIGNLASGETRELGFLIHRELQMDYQNRIEVTCDNLKKPVVTSCELLWPVA